MKYAMKRRDWEQLMVQHEGEALLDDLGESSAAELRAKFLGVG